MCCKSRSPENLRKPRSPLIDLGGTVYWGDRQLDWLTWCADLVGAAGTRASWEPDCHTERPCTLHRCSLLLESSRYPSDAMLQS